MQQNTHSELNGNFICQRVKCVANHVWLSRTVVACTSLLLLAACSSLPLDATLTASSSASLGKSACANLDWYEAGRSDGSLGYPLRSGLAQHRENCTGPSIPNDVDLYSNGREAGLIIFCSPTGGIEAGRSGAQYEDVCPSNLEASFLSHYELGQRLRLLDGESSELSSRISNLTDLLSPVQKGDSIKSQIERLKARQNRLKSEISRLEDRGDKANPETL